MGMCRGCALPGDRISSSSSSHCSFLRHRGVLVPATCVCAMSTGGILPVVACAAVGGTACSGPHYTTHPEEPAHNTSRYNCVVQHAVPSVLDTKCAS